MSVTARPLSGLKPASEAQLSYIRNLAEQKLTSGLSEGAIVVLADVLSGDTDLVAMASASLLIDSLQRAPRRPADPETIAKPGYYVRDENGGRSVFVVVNNRAGTSTYAKRLDLTVGRASWEYAPGVGRTLAGLEPLTVEEAGRLGTQHGVCIICCKTLTDPKSVERGIGPVCAKRLS